MPVHQWPTGLVADNLVIWGGGGGNAHQILLKTSLCAIRQFHWFYLQIKAVQFNNVLGWQVGLCIDKDSRWCAGSFAINSPNFQVVYCFDNHMPSERKGRQCSRSKSQPTELRLIITSKLLENSINSLFNSITSSTFEKYSALMMQGKKPHWDLKSSH